MRVFTPAWIVIGGVFLAHYSGVLDYAAKIITAIDKSIPVVETIAGAVKQKQNARPFTTPPRLNKQPAK